MAMNRFSGVCVGGPNAGTSIESRVPVLEFPLASQLMHSMPADDFDPSETFETTKYHYEEYHHTRGEIGYWRHESLHDGFAVMLALISNYSMTAYKAD